MFVSSPSFEFDIPEALQEPGTRYWRVLLMPSMLPWYLAMFESTEEGMTFVHSMCFCWETDLVESIQSAPASALLSLQMVRPSEDRHGWSVRSIARVWRLRDASKSDQRSFYTFECEDGACVSPMSGDELSSDLSDREIAVEVRRRRRGHQEIVSRPR